MSSRLAPYVLCLLAAQILWAQPEPLSTDELARPLRLTPLPLRFERITLEDGLSQVSVFSIFQDSKGYMWFGTQDGLNRFDGRSIDVYRSIPFDSTTLSANSVSAIAEGPDGAMWIGTEASGINRLDPETGIVTRYTHESSDSTSLSNDFVTSLLWDRDSTLWIGTRRGLNRFDANNATFERYSDDAKAYGSLSGKQVLGLSEDQAGNVWVSTNNGISRVGRDGKIRHFGAVQKGDDWTISHIFHSSYPDPESEDTLWIATETGPARLETASGRLVHFSLGRGGVNDAVTRIAPDPESSRHLWLAAPRLGLVRFDKYDGSSSVYSSSAGDDQSFPSSSVIAIYSDRSGMVWAGTRLAGVVKFDPAGQSFTHFRSRPGAPYGLSAPAVFSVSEDTEGHLWVASVGDGGGYLDRLDRESGGVRSFSPEYDGGRIGAFSVIYRDRSGNLWFGSDGHIDRLNSQGRFERFSIEEVREARRIITRIFQDARGTYWIGTAAGVLRFDPASGSFEAVNFPGDEGALINAGTIRAIDADSAGSLWIGTLQSGLFNVDSTGSVIARYGAEDAPGRRLGSDHIMTVHEQSGEPGLLWVGTFAGGLSRIDRRTGQIDVFTTRDGLPNDVVYCILEDNNGHLWLSTNRGLARFDPVTKNVRSYTTSDGLQSYEYNQGACYRSEDGELFFGGVNGLNAFYPGQERINRNPPQVVITGFRLQNVPVQFGPGSPLEQPVAYLNEIRLGPNQNTFGFDFAALHYEDPYANRFAYRLEGLDAEWIDAGTSTTATYTNLDPGDYIFRVKAANSDGVWNESGASIAIVIRPPWWQTIWALLLYGLLAVGAAVGLHRAQRSRVIRKERERALIREKELRAEAAEARAKYLHAENLRKTQELESARQLQLSMLPDKLPDHAVANLAASMQTATEVGGDYYDFRVDEDGSLLIVIGDATGHGVEAGTVVTATKGMLSMLTDVDDLASVLSSASAALRRMHLPGLFMALAIVRLRGRSLEFAGAGMPPALIFRSRTGEVDDVSLKGVPLGAPFSYNYFSRQVSVVPDDVVLLMSDGLTELFGDDGEMFGIERLRDVLKQVAHLPADEIVEGIFERSKDWSGDITHRDDMTLVVLKIRREASARDNRIDTD